MSLADLIVVNVSLAAGGLSAPGFGVPAILSNTGNAWGTPELWRSYGAITDVAVDFATITPEYAAANALFAQSPAPTSILILKGPTKPTMVQTIAISSVVDSTKYKVKVWTKGLLWDASFTSGVGTDNDTIVAGLVAALTPSAWQNNHVYTAGQRATNDTGKIFEVTVGGTSANAGGPTGTGQAIVDNTVTWKYISTPNFTAAATGAGGAHVVTATGSAAGNWFALEPIASGDPSAVSNLMALTETTANPGIATDLTAARNATDAWYALVVLFKSTACLATGATSAAGWVESNNKLLIAAPVDTACCTAAYALSGADPCNTVKDLGYARTSTFYHPRAYEFADAAKEGRFLPTNPGSDNWRMKSFKGVTAVTYTPTQIANLKAKNAAFYYILGTVSNGISVDGGDGKTGSGEYIDVARFIDWWVANLSTSFVNLEYQVTKIPFTDDGIALIENLVRQWNAAGIVAGGIARFPVPIVTAPKASDVPAGDRADRWLGETSGKGIATSWVLAGAINKLTVTANVTQ